MEVTLIHLGDITKLRGYSIPPVDVITGGSPCQDLSVAGNRAGLNGKRSGLFMDQTRIIREMREERNGRANDTVRPRYMVWENVPGALSCNNGEDFRAVLEETARIVDKNAVIPRPPGGKWRTSGAIMGDGWSIAWRIHDAQFWGVPQRRRRIALVADFGGDTAPEILFEREGLPRDIETSGTTREGASGDAENSAYPAIARSLTTRHDGSPCVDRGPNIVVAGFNGKAGAKSVSIAYKEETAPTLRAGQEMHVFENHAQDSRITGPLSVSPTVSRTYGAGGNNTPLVMGFRAYGEYTETETGKTLLSSDDITTDDLVVESAVRRLTPLECERLQGYPDGWTDIEWDEIKQLKRGFKTVHKTATDSQRYRALGNSIALPPWRWVLGRIAAYLPEGATLGSLFDGIGGFPLIWEEINGKGSAVWASEIESFPIEVTRIRFGGVRR